MTHMGSTEGYIWRVDRGKAEELYRLDNEPADPGVRRRRCGRPRGSRSPRRKPNPSPSRLPPGSSLPADHARRRGPQDRRDPGRLVQRIYRTDARLAHWAKMHELKIGYRWGRPDAVGAYPSVRSVLPIEEPGKPLGLLFATRMDGFVRLADGKETASLRPVSSRSSRRADRELVGRDPGLRGAMRVTRRRPLAIPRRGLEPGLVRAAVRAGTRTHPRPGWRPGRGLDEDERPDRSRRRDRHDQRVAASTPGTRTTARWRNGKAEVLGREDSELNPSACFLTPDGSSGMRITRLAAIRRRPVEPIVDALPMPRGVDRAEWIGIGLGLRTVNDAGPPWILLDRHNEMLLRLSYGPGFKDPRLSSSP